MCRPTILPLQGAALAQRELPVIETAAIAWRDAFQAIDVMPVVAGIAFVLYLVVSLAVSALAISAINPNPFALIGSPWLPIISIIAGIVQAALLAPLAIAVHRFVLLGEKTNRYPLEPKSSRYLRFVGFSILVKILWLIPFIEDLLPAARDMDSASSPPSCSPRLSSCWCGGPSCFPRSQLMRPVRRGARLGSIQREAPGAWPSYSF
jgi:hypothetical protein